MRLGQKVIAAVLWCSLVASLAVPGGALADTTIDFEQYPAETAITDQYASEGVTFGPLPSGNPGAGLAPVVRVPPAGQAHSGAQVADIATCPACEFFTPRTTGTLGTPRAQLSVYVGYLGASSICTAVNPDAAGCAIVRLRAFDANGNELAQTSARVTRGAGILSRLAVSVPTATIVGFEISGRAGTDASKPIAIDDLTFGTPVTPTVTPGTTPTATPTLGPDFTLNPAAIDVTVEQGSAAGDAITIGRLSGSTGAVSMTATGLPAGVSATFEPNPATGTLTVLTLTAAANAPPTTATVTITGTPQTPSAGPGPRTFTLTLTIQAACPQVRTAQELVDRLAAGFTCIFVTGEIDLQDVLDPDHPVTGPPAILGEPSAILAIPDGVTLMGGRSPTQFGGVLGLSQRPADHAKKAALRLGANTRITGLRLRGYNLTDRHDRKDKTRAIIVDGSPGVTIDGNEISGWPHSGVYVVNTTDLLTAPHVTGNFIHNNVECNEGQGVQFSTGGFARIDHNLFNYNRHDVGSLGVADGYLAEFNFSLESGPKCDAGDTFQHYNQHYDMHGTGSGGYGGRAGNSIVIRNNTIRGAQVYYQLNRRAAFWLRGTPDTSALFTANAIPHAKGLDQSSAGAFGHGVTVSSGAVRVRGASVLQLLTKKKLVIRHNRTCVDTPTELAVGDFNGDGRDDVFGSVGTEWVYSPSGQREWFFLSDSTVRLRDLALGDFTGDGTADVFVQDGDRWLLSDGGTAMPMPLPVGSKIDIANYRFGDFDGDHRTDVFRTNGKRFFVSSAAATTWLPLPAPGIGLSGLRLGDFDGDGTTDVFSLAGNQWSVSFGGRTGWQRLNRKLAGLGGLVFADFDGDGKTDIARNHDGNWQVSSAGATAWTTLQFHRSEPLATGMLFGDFTGDGRADALRYGALKNMPASECAPQGKRLEAFQRYRLSAGGASPFDTWSVADMR
ncbi:MAG: hypothetical protein QOF76_3764 [Solirubrobacteraceae bacterium]|nr:hypothetical protein [Solirubrobacteraceae bacterium]